MTKQDYVLIALTLRQQWEEAKGTPTIQATILATATRLSSALISTSPRFDRERFLLSAIGISNAQ